MKLEVTELKFEEVKNSNDNTEDFGKLLQAGCCTRGSGGCETWPKSPVKEPVIDKKTK